MSIAHFDGEFRFLSNFYPFQVKMEGMVYPSVEHAYQAAKSLDMVDRRMIAELSTPGKAKRAGRILRIRNDWMNIRIPVMEYLVRQKFGKNSILREKLIETYPEELIEGNDWGDTFWGMVAEYKDKNPMWIGENHLGEILMKIRQECLWDF